MVVFGAGAVVARCRGEVHIPGHAGFRQRAKHEGRGRQARSGGLRQEHAGFASRFRRSLFQQRHRVAKLPERPARFGRLAIQGVGLVRRLRHLRRLVQYISQQRLGFGRPGCRRAPGEIGGQVAIRFRRHHLGEGTTLIRAGDALKGQRCQLDPRPRVARLGRAFQPVARFAKVLRYAQAVKIAAAQLGLGVGQTRARGGGDAFDRIGARPRPRLFPGER